MPRRQAAHADPLPPAFQDGANALPLDTAPRIDLGDGREGRYGLCPIARLLPNPHAVRVHPKRQIDKLARSMAVSGTLAPLVIDEHHLVLAGHGRLEAAKRDGRSAVPVVQVFRLSEAQRRTFLLADNRVAEDGRLDREKLAGQLPELTLLLEEVGFALTDTGYEVAEFDELVLDFDDAGDPDDAVDPALAEAPVALQRGDELRLGHHRLAVGDARDEGLLDRLMDGQRAEAAFLDPPYNVKVAGIVGRGRVQHAEFAMASGEMTRPEFVAFLQATLGNAARVSRPGAVHFVCMDWKHVRELVEAGDGVYAAHLNLVVWNKTNAGQGGLYRNQHELVGVFRVGSEPHRDNVQQGRLGRNRSNVWTYPGVNTFRSGRLDDLAAHPTVKPVALVADALKDVTRRGGLVLDSFLGSGTTLLAGERVGRRVHAVEYEPRFAQIAARRWERMTGRAAVHDGTGLSLDDLAERRASRCRDLAPSPPDATADAGSTSTAPDSAAAGSAPPVARARVRSRPPA